MRSTGRRSASDCSAFASSGPTVTDSVASPGCCCAPYCWACSCRPWSGTATVAACTTKPPASSSWSTRTRPSPARRPAGQGRRRPFSWAGAHAEEGTAGSQPAQAAPLADLAAAWHAGRDRTLRDRQVHLPHGSQPPVQVIHLAAAQHPALAHQRVLQLPERHLALAVADDDVDDRNVARDL